MFVVPKKLIQTPEDLDKFRASSAFSEVVDFVLRLNESVKGKPIRYEHFQESQTITSILQVLSQLETWISEIEPLPNKSRFGNKAFCTFLNKVAEKIDDLMKIILPENVRDSTVEISPYFLNCMGDYQRIDYGSGHELNFVMWMYCLEKMNLVGPPDYPALVLEVFNKYLTVMRQLQTKYWLEPAGSHGVWGLDDYQFLPFLWGSSQLIDHKYIRPKSITNKETVDNFAADYMYLGCIKFINEVKTGSFFEHSPLLFDITGAKSWEKVNSGMIKMFKAEVLGKLPVMKHFFFGSLLQLDLASIPNVEQKQECNDDDHHHHSHAHTHDHSSGLYSFKSCCVQRIPSVFSAKEHPIAGVGTPSSPQNEVTNRNTNNSS